MKRLIYFLFCIFMFSFLVGCGFHFQGQVNLAPPLQRMYLQTNDPYGTLARALKQFLKMSHVELTSNPAEATTVLTILRDETSQNLLSVSGTQQTRQYVLVVTVDFQIADVSGKIIVPSHALIETRPLTVQSNQILGSSNEANLFYQQMRRSLAGAIINRIASREVTQEVMHAFANQPTVKPS